MERNYSLHPFRNIIIWTFRVEVIDICQCHLFSGRSSYPTKRKQYHPYFQPSLLALFPLIILCYFPENLNRGTLAGVTITYLVISLLLAIYTYLTEQIKGFFFILAVIHWLFCSFHPCLLFCQNSTCRSLLSMRQAFVLR